jgi:hypothetical protein
MTSTVRKPVGLISTFWEHESFREALSSLLTMSPEQLATLRELTRGGYDIDPAEAAEVLDGSPAQLAPVLAVLEVIYGSARAAEVSGEEVVREIESRVRSRPDEFGDIDFSAKQDQLIELLSMRPDVESSELLKRVEAAVFPALERSFFAVDYRYIPASQVMSVGDEGRLVPVIAVRLTMDEPASTSGNAVSFQMSAETARRVSEQLHEVLQSIDEGGEYIGPGKVL